MGGGEQKKTHGWRRMKKNSGAGEQKNKKNSGAGEQKNIYEKRLKVFWTIYDIGTSSQDTRCNKSPRKMKIKVILSTLKKQILPNRTELPHPTLKKKKLDS